MPPGPDQTRAFHRIRLTLIVLRSDWHVMDACDPGREILLIGSRERAVAGARDP